MSVEESGTNRYHSLARIFRPIINIALSAIILMMPALLNRSPFLFYDTSHYLEFGRSIAQRLPVFSSLVDDQTQAISQAGQVVPATPISEEKEREHPSLSYAGGRSPYYSLLVYVLIKVGGLWAVVFLQALLAATLLWIAYQLVTSSLPTISFLFSTIALSALSSLSFYSDMTMPDIFAGLALVALGLLTLGFDRLTILARIGLVAFIASAACAHATIPFICAAGLVSLAGAQFVLNRGIAIRRWRVLGWAMVGLVLAICGSMLFSTASKLILRDAPQSPPYLMARVLADGTGRAYLHEACHPSSKYFLCRFEARKFRNHDDFLWSDDPTFGVFSVSDYETRKRLKAEELSFVLDTINRYPLWQADVSAGHWVRQLASFGLSEFDEAERSWDSMAFNRVIPEQAKIYKSGLAYQGYFPFKVFDWLQQITVIISIVWLVLRFTSPDVRAALVDTRVHGPNVEALLVSAAIGLSGGLVVNAAVCGVLSGVNDRYQARLIWLVPFLATLALCRLGLCPSNTRVSELAKSWQR
jgi:hypothetical protein